MSEYDVENNKIVQKPKEKYHTYRFLIVIGVVLFVLAVVLLSIFVTPYVILAVITAGPILWMLGVLCYIAYVVFWLDEIKPWLFEKKKV